jgi:hypothetical protein
MTSLLTFPKSNHHLSIKLFLELSAFLVFSFTTSRSSKLLYSTPSFIIGVEKQQTFDISCWLSYYYMSVDISAPAILQQSVIYLFSARSLFVCVTLSPRPSVSRYTLFLLFSKICAIALAFSNSFKLTYDRDFLMASPISSADLASP